MCATSQCECEIRPLAGGKVVKTEPKITTPPGHPAHIPIVPRVSAVLTPDVLSKATAKQKEIVDFFYNIVARASSNSKVQTILRSSQPVHAGAILAVCFVCSNMLTGQTKVPKPYSGFTSFVYLSTFSLHIGSQFWMTFVSGLTLYFTLSRHAFGDVQRILFPRYFTLNSILSAVNLFAFTKLTSHISWSTEHWVQTIAITLSFLLQMLGRLYIVPGLIKVMDKKRAIEESEPGVGQEVGCHKPGRLEQCPHYMAIHNSFRKHHSIMAVANILSMICTVVQAFCITSSMNIIVA